MSSKSEWEKHFSKRYQTYFWYNLKNNQSSWYKPYFSYTYKQYYYIHPKTKKSIWFDSKDKKSDTKIIKPDNVKIVNDKKETKETKEPKESKKESDQSVIDRIQKDLKNMKIDKKKDLKPKKSVNKYCVSNGLGHYHEYEASDNWDKYDHMEYLRDLRDSMNPYD